jgi:hypothetical protein
MPEQVFHVNGELGSDAPQVTAMALIKPKIAGAASNLATRVSPGT